MRYYWNDKEVSVEEYEALDLEWKKQVEAQELQEKNSEKSNSGSGKKSRNQKIG
jgi:hypothetical protein